MYKLSLVLLTTIHFGLVAQNGFYIRPAVESKFYTSTLYGGGEKYIPQNEHYTVAYNRIGFDPNVNWGLGLGYSFPKNNSSLELVVFQDFIRCKTVDIYSSQYFPVVQYGEFVDNEHLYGQQSAKNGSGYVNAVRFELVYSKQRKINDFLNINILAGIGASALTPLNKALTSEYPDFVVLPTEDNYIDEETGMVYMHTGYLSSNFKFGAEEVYVSGIRRVNMNIKLGAQFEINSKNHHLCTVGLYYLQGVSSFVTVRNLISVIDIENNINHIYSYKSSSRGSGFYIQLSRKIHFRKNEKGEK
jgi:hypothetical protein